MLWRLLGSCLRGDVAQLLMEEAAAAAVMSTKETTTTTKAGVLACFQ
jgi:hypothetical protein